MAERKSSMGSKHRLAQFLRQQPLTGTDRDIASSHEINRQSVVKEIIVHVFFMSKYGLLQGGLTVAEATAQYIRSTGDNQAAHNAPGQILSGGRQIQSLITGSDDLELSIENLFGKTDDVPSRFNKADSRAEENGLRNALLNACSHAANAGRFAKFQRTEFIAPLFATAFERYRSLGLQAYQIAAQRQRQLMRPNDPVENANRESIISILGFYTNTLQKARATHETVLGLDPEDIWREFAAL